MDKMSAASSCLVGAAVLIAILVTNCGGEDSGPTAPAVEATRRVPLILPTSAETEETALPATEAAPTQAPPTAAPAPPSPVPPTATPPSPTPVPPTQSPLPSPTVPPAPAANCDPSYPGVCIPRPPPDLDCGDITFRRFQVLQPDPHRFDADRDGVGCESG